MASGRVHNFVTMALIIPTAYMGYSLSGGDALAGLIEGGGCALALLVDPDLDIDTGTRNKNRAKRAFGPFAIPWLVFWHAYSLAVPHRSPISHLPILGTLIRLTYWILGTLLLAYLIDPALAGWIVGEVLRPVSGYGLWAIMGFMISDFAHWVFDGAPLRGKKK